MFSTATLTCPAAAWSSRRSGSRKGAGRSATSSSPWISGPRLRGTTITERRSSAAPTLGNTRASAQAELATSGPFTRKFQSDRASPSTG